MKSLRVFDGHLRYAVLAVTLVLAAVVPAFASAAQLTERSVALSSSSKAATGVSYDFNFTAATTAGAVVVEFCSDTPLIGEACTPVANNFSIADATVTGGTKSGTWTASKGFITKSITAGTVNFSLAGVHNPDVAGTIYARVITYDTLVNAQAYASNALGSGVADSGSAAIAITDTIGVSGAVLETMTFCVSGATIDPNCGGGLTAPTLRLGKNTGGVIALDSTDTYDGTIYTQISTNAAKGAVVSLKSDALNCGGLRRSSDLAACDIPAAGGSGQGVQNGTAGFGVKLGANSATADGTVQAAGTYSSSAYLMNFVNGNATGVTSTYGDPLFDTDDLPANNKAMPLTFGASVSNNTPAGNYSANLSLIATGKF